MQTTEEAREEAVNALFERLGHNAGDVQTVHDILDTLADTPEGLVWMRRILAGVVLGEALGEQA